MDKKIIENLPIEAYHYDDPYRTFIGSTLLKAADSSMKKYLYEEENLSKGERKIHFDFGNAFELAFLDQDEFNKKVAIMDLKQMPFPDKDFRTKANKEWRDCFISENEDKYIVQKEGDSSIASIYNMIDSCKNNKVINILMSNMDYQKSIFWTDKETGLCLKARPDTILQEKKTIVDVKTCEDASPRKVENAVNNFKYHLQAIQQIEGVESSGIIDKVENYFWLFVEKNAPYHVEVYEFHPEDRKSVKLKYRALLNKIAESKSTGEYPGYGQIAGNEYGILRTRIY